MTDALRGAGLTVPTEHGKLTAASKDGSASAGPRAAVFLFPDGSSDGMLEDLCLRAVAGDAATPCLDAYFQCIQERGLTIAPNKQPKARVHAYLASRPEPDKRLGEAAEARYWPWEAAALAPLIALVRGL